MINVKCECCKEDLTTPGALLFSPPEVNIVIKYHICVECFEELQVVISSWLVNHMAPTK